MLVQIVVVVIDYVCDVREQGCSFDDEVVFVFGVLIGVQYVCGFGWYWGDVIWDGDLDSVVVGVFSFDELLFNNFIGWVSQIVESGGGVLFMFSYNMILVNQVLLFEWGSVIGFY